jgi:hypothetical protein
MPQMRQLGRAIGTRNATIRCLRNSRQIRSARLGFVYRRRRKMRRVGNAGIPKASAGQSPSGHYRHALLCRLDKRRILQNSSRPAGPHARATLGRARARPRKGTGDSSKLHPRRELNLQATVPKANLRRFSPRASLDVKSLNSIDLGKKQSPIPACSNVQFLQEFSGVTSDSVPDSVPYPEVAHR